MDPEASKEIPDFDPNGPDSGDEKDVTSGAQPFGAEVMGSQIMKSINVPISFIGAPWKDLTTIVEKSINDLLGRIGKLRDAASKLTKPFNLKPEPLHVGTV